jgi:MerR family transcriptional regulator, copper efflux regulator
MKIGEVAERAHVSRSIIRYYERIGLLPCALRDCSGYREYGESDLARIQLVAVARRFGCSFADIKAIVAMKEKRYIPSAQILELLEHKAEEVGREMERLERVQRELSRLHDLGITLAGGEAVSTD